MNPKTGRSMNVIWSGFAKECLKEISLYYTKIAGPGISQKIRGQVFHSTRHLIKHPKSGQVKPLLQGQEQEFRFCIAGNYKIIYTIVEEGILITDVFDTRQNPIKMNKPDRKQ